MCLWVCLFLLSNYLDWFRHDALHLVLVDDSILSRLCCHAAAFCDMTHSYLWHDSFIHVCRDSFVCVPRRIHICYIYIFVTWLIALQIACLPEPVSGLRKQDLQILDSASVRIQVTSTNDLTHLFSNNRVLQIYSLFHSLFIGSWIQVGFVWVWMRQVAHIYVFRLHI